MGIIKRLFGSRKEERYQKTVAINVDKELYLYVLTNYVKEADSGIRYSISVDKSDSLKEYIEDNINNDSFSQKLFSIIEEKQVDEVALYNKARIDRKLFSKIRSDKSYMPSKKTVFSLSIALMLSKEETEELLKNAGYAINMHDLRDVIISYHLDHHKYNIDVINSDLVQFNQDPLFY